MQPFSIDAITVTLGERAINLAAEFPLFAPAIKKTGIETVFETARAAVDLAVDVVQKMLDREPTIMRDLGALVVVSQSPSNQLPSMAFEIQDRCAIGKEILAFDINQGCSGFVQALQLAVSTLSWSKNVLIVCTDRYRSKLRTDDRSTNAVFSDAATATLITNRPSLEIAACKHHSDGAGRNLLYQSLDITENSGKLFMSGSEVWLWTKRVVLSQIADLLASENMSLDEVDEIFFHQASELVLNGLQAQISSGVRVPRRLRENGNTVSSSIPILLEDRLADLPTQTSVLSGFGVGLSCSSLLIRPKQDVL